MDTYKNPYLCQEGDALWELFQSIQDMPLEKPEDATFTNHYGSIHPWNKGSKGLQEFSPETRAKISAAHKGRKPWNFGISGYKNPFTEKALQKMKELNTGKKMSPESREKMSLAQKERYKNPEQLAAMAARSKAQMKSKWQNPEYRQMMIQARNKNKPESSS